MEGYHNSVPVIRAQPNLGFGFGADPGRKWGLGVVEIVQLCRIDYGHTVITNARLRP